MASHIGTPGELVSGWEEPGHTHFIEPHRHNEAQRSGVSWGAVIGGAFVAAAFYLMLLALGAGLGLSAISPWSNNGAAAAALGTAAIVWLVAIEIVASALGGYLTGRLRTKWAVIHSDEVFFRDTANGFLAWAVALIVSVGFLTSAAASMVGSVGEASPASEVVSGSIADPNAYFVDALFRTDRIAPDYKTPPMKAEAGRVFARGLTADFTQQDLDYLARLTATQTGMTYPEAQTRVRAVITDAKISADIARKATAHMLLWTCLALLMGALSASYAATIGGRQRDHVKVV